MLTRLETCVGGLCEADESLMDKHGIGILDGYSYQLPVHVSCMPVKAIFLVSQFHNSSLHPVVLNRDSLTC